MARGTLIEFAPECGGIGELTLPLPALQATAREKKPVALIRPPYMPYAPALRRAGLPLKQLLWITETNDDDARWASEQLLRDGAGAVLLWTDARDDRASPAARGGMRACARLRLPLAGMPSALIVRSASHRSASARHVTAD